jgi:hypothetical protein
MKDPVTDASEEDAGDHTSAPTPHRDHVGFAFLRDLFDHFRGVSHAILVDTLNPMDRTARSAAATIFSASLRMPFPHCSIAVVDGITGMNPTSAAG